ncbi:protein tramtrack, alpha isoform isoform X1 [Bombus affinis]|uniref:Protein tramtrack, alpha isoform isoform X1 n=1 Tax=Bombus terrestris TaxID=30195 RepID=A0A9C6SGP6_BOMTE|nr:protein tramtrack, alpha isoform isoform X1 [Bombus terrestris]XP_048260305.1 protein tramtrack, alpha isoform isoform X1 [Bombus terrestris]XP_048260306.1 protein tramtrack, alpha isoform isoform X1 [Bombus terrestris]XP_048260307.1 protein tramtrack, alpha isoform isoform X1 [Bombus terrestris]XP_048260308.1 protein tramtrack, alpha isoform isoform X1 [Bombus terrestris]XP_048260309.1 protein tramtrack, alpha isoform isoform X1 [Bombus terrestris]XP_048260310.1 protein tramtrack, alpha i
MLADINGNLADLRSEAMASQRFCLRWNNHQSNLLSVFDQLLHDESFVDVTLAVEGQLLRAHKMVLSACSPYFQALFVGHPDKHPIVILKDVPYVDMRSLLDFMYRGEVSVDQDRLTAFLRVAESLRIKGLTEVNEDKCDLPSITSSLLGNQNTVPPPPPNLHRINQIGPHHHVSQKRMHHMSSHPLLGSALSAPKRKRGRPRKLSGSSDTPIGEITGQELQSCSGTDLVQGSPEMMEMKMSIDFQSESTGNNGRGGNSSTASASSNNVNSNNVGNSASSGTSLAASSLSSTRKDEPTENGTDTPESLTSRVKREPEPTPSTSAQASDETFARPHSRQGNEGFKQEFSSGNTKSDGETWKEKGRNSGSGSSANQSSTDTSNARSNTTTSLTTTTSSTSSTASSSGTTMTTTSTRSSSMSPATGRNNAQNSGGSSSSSSPAPTTNSSSTSSGHQIGTMSAPPGRQVPKRRMRRRATSHSQDPAEQLTEMSVRGLNLFRYASISEGVYQCTECAKLDIQKTFKNKYSFQRHAFLYHEGHQRKVFPCPVCGKEFSRPDKMKNHMKTVHDCFMPKDCVMPFGFFLSP